MGPERLASGRIATVEVAGGLVVELREHHVEERDIDLASLALEDLGDQPEGGRDPRGVVDSGVAGQRGWTVRLTRQCRHPHPGLGHVVEGGPLGGRAVEPVPRQGHAYDLGVVTAQGVVVEPEPLDRRRAEVHQQGVGGLDQGAEL